MKALIVFALLGSGCASVTYDHGKATVKVTPDKVEVYGDGKLRCVVNGKVEVAK